MKPAVSLDELVETLAPSLSPAEQRMALFFCANKEAVLLSSAADIAARAGTSDATVIRTVRALGFDGLLGLREAILSELTGGGPKARLKRTLDHLDQDPDGILAHVLGVHVESLSSLSAPAFSAAFKNAVDLISQAERRHVFGIGPSSHLAEYATQQFSRIGFQTQALSRSGIGLADGLLSVRPGDCILLIAYAPIYREVTVILDLAEEVDAPVILIGDTMAPLIGKRVAETLPVPRGRTESLSMHGATLVLIEAMIVALAVTSRETALTSLDTLSRLRGAISKDWTKRGRK